MSYSGVVIGLFPGQNENAIDPVAAVAAEARTPPADGGVWLYTNMIASADGGTAVSGISGHLGADGDRVMFAALRSVADFIIVGAATVREERYLAPIQDQETADARLDRGQQPHPTLAIVSRSLNVPLDLPVFDQPDHRPIVVTVESSDQSRRRQVEERAELVVAGQSDVDFELALDALASRGGRTILCEGGPSINGQLINAGLVDEWNLSVAPSLLGADSKRAAVGPLPEGPPTGMTLTRVWADDDFLFCRWVKKKD